MHTWDIAKLLLTHCGSPEDVRQMVEVLQDPTTVKDICVILDRFVEGHDSTDGYHQIGSAGATGRVVAPSPPLKPGKLIPRSRTAGNVNLTAADELASLFRVRGMTNHQVELWLFDSFALHLSVGKDSLRKYLARVLNSTDLGTRNRIIAAAQRLTSDGTERASEITEYWNELDKRFASQHD